MIRALPRRALATGVAATAAPTLLVVLTVMVVAIQAAQAQTGDASRNPDDLTTRSALITGYFHDLSASKIPEPDIEQKREQNIFWLIEHHPDAKLAGSPEAHIQLRGRYGSTEGYQRRKQLWLQQADSHSDNVRILDNAAKFVSLEDPKLGRQLLEKALA